MAEIDWMRIRRAIIAKDIPFISIRTLTPAGIQGILRAPRVDVYLIFSLKHKKQKKREKKEKTNLELSSLTPIFSSLAISPVFHL